MNLGRKYFRQPNLIYLGIRFIYKRTGISHRQRKRNCTRSNSEVIRDNSTSNHAILRKIIKLQQILNKIAQFPTVRSLTTQIRERDWVSEV